ncbi:MAG: hypothetical protein AAF799_36765 [Myxococcota bacterium]
MARLHLFHWKPEEATPRIEQLQRLGHEVEYVATVPTSFKALASAMPDAVVIDLSRLPSHGREVALAIRERKGTRGIPLVFVGGDPAKVERLRAQLPDATYASWRGIKGAVSRAMKRKVASPVVPSARAGGYSGTPLPRKLGIKANMKVAILGAPDGIEQTLGELPPGVVLRRDARGTRALTLWFTTSVGELRRRIDKLAAQVGDGGLWIAWPKKTSALATELTQADVRGAGLDAGLVDYKICAIDADWSALKFGNRRA